MSNVSFHFYVYSNYFSLSHRLYHQNTSSSLNCTDYETNSESAVYSPIIIPWVVTDVYIFVTLNEYAKIIDHAKVWLRNQMSGKMNAMLPYIFVKQHAVYPLDHQFFTQFTDINQGRKLHLNVFSHRILIG